MISFVQQTPGVKELFNQFAERLEIKPVDGRLNVPSSWGKGYVQLEHLPNGLNVLIMNYCLNDDLFYERPPGSKEFYTLRSREINVKNSAITTIDNEEAQEPRGMHKSLYLTTANIGLCTATPVRKLDKNNIHCNGTSTTAKTGI